MTSVALRPLVALVAFAVCAPLVSAQEKPRYLDPTLPVEARLDDLLPRLTLAEKISLIHADSKFTVAGVPRLGIPKLWLSDGPHGVREEIGPDTWDPAGRTDDFATWLPVSIALAATWNVDLAAAYGDVIATEARQRGKTIMLGPGVNIQRTPLNGRTFEYLGEDPWLASRLAVAYIRAMQAGQVAACVKHFAANNQETARNSINVEMDERTLREIYLPAFEAAVKEGGVLSVMGAYNKFRGEFCCHNDYLLNRVLKGEWGFSGLVVSDWNGVHETRQAVLNGLDLEMGTDNKPSYDEFYLARPFREAIERGEFPVALLDDKVRRNLRVLFTTGAVDGRRAGAINTPAHQATARRIAEEAIVLLKNTDAALPLDLSRVKSIAVIGENATRLQAHGGWSSEIKAFYEITPLQGIVARVGARANITYAKGYQAPLRRRAGAADGAGVRRMENAGTAAEDSETLIARAVAAAKAADVAIIVGGLTHETNQDTEGSDRRSLELPYNQAELIARVTAANPRTVVVLAAGSPVAMDPWLEKTPAVVQAWYAGMEGGHALAAVLFGDVNPSGKLPCTFPRRIEDSPAHASGSKRVFPGENGTVSYDEGVFVGYRWFDSRAIEPLLAFGHGLSYTSFAYSDLRVTADAAEPASLVVECTLTNTGARAGSETVQVYVHDRAAAVARPEKELRGFAKIALQPGESWVVRIPLSPRALAFYSADAKGWIAEAGEFEVLVGASSRDVRLRAPYVLAATRTLP